MCRKAVLLFAIIGVSTASGQDAQFPIERDAAWQQRIRAVVLKPLTQLSNEVYARDFARLLVDARAERGRFAQQIVYYACHLEDQVLAPGVYRLLHWAEMSQHEIGTALGGFLYSPDKRLREQVRDLFPFVVCGEGGDRCGADYSGLRSLVKDGGTPDEIAVPLTRMMFESSPTSAFLLFHNDAGREVVAYRRYGRVISNALYEKQHLDGIPRGRVDQTTMDAVRDLAKSKYWWARLFAAEIMVQNKEFRDVPTLATLESDAHELVRKSVQSISKDDPLRATKVDR